MTLVSIRLFPVPTTAHQVCELEIASEDQDSGGGIWLISECCQIMKSLSRA